MKISKRVEMWLHGLFAAMISGGASAIISGLTTMGFAPDKFNLSDLKGFEHLATLMIANFLLSGFLAAMFYLKQSPLPPESTGNTDFFAKPNIPSTDLPKVP